MAENNLTMADMHTDEIISVKIVINGYEITQENRFFKSVTINTGCTQDGYISYGGTFSPSCTISMQDHELIQNGTFFEIYFKIQNHWEHFGKFKVNQEPQRADDLVDFSAEGMISAVFDNVVLQLTKEMCRRLHGIREIVEKLETVTGIEIEIEESLTNGAQSMMFPIKAEDVKKAAPTSSYSARGLLGEVAFLLGGNAVERNGRIYIEDASRKSSTQTVMFGKDTYSDCTISKKTYAPMPVKVSFQDVSVVTNKETDGKTYNYNCYTSGDKKVYTLDSSWVSSESRPDVTYDLVIESDLAGFNIGSSHGPGPGGSKIWNWTGKNPRPYRPFEADFCGYHPQITAGNDIIIEDETGTGQQVYCDTVTYEWDGGMSIKAASSFNASVGGGTNASTITSSASGTATQVAGVRNEVEAFKSVYTDYVEANSAKIGELETANATIKETLTANEAKIEEIKTKGITTDNLAANVSKIGKLEADDAIVKAMFSDSIIADTAILERLQTNILSTEKINSMVAEINTLTADDALIKNIQSVVLSTEYIRSITADIGYLTAEAANLKYADITLGNINTANIDKGNIALLFNEVGLIDRATIVDGHITGFLDAVEINARNITLGELSTDRLIIRGNDKSIVFELNNITGALQAQEVDTLNGEIITKRTISADKVIAESITTKELDVTQIFADEAVIQQLFAQNITATGTISGAILKGAEAEIIGGKIGDLIISGGEIRGGPDNNYLQLKPGALQFDNYKGGGKASTYLDLTGLTIMDSGWNQAYGDGFVSLSLQDGLRIGKNDGTTQIKISAGRILPQSNNDGYIGISDRKWKEMYAATFHGNLDGSATSAGYASSANYATNADSANSASYATNAGNADTVDGKHFHWNGQGGQPSWLWGGDDGTNMYVYNPSNFSVNYATSAGSANALSTTLPTTNNFATNLLSYCSKSGLTYASNAGYYNLYAAFSDNLNSQFVTAVGTGYRIERSGYYHLYIRAYLTACSDQARVKRLGIRSGSTTGSWLIMGMGRSQTYELLNDSGAMHLGTGTILVPVFQMDPNGSTVTTATVDAIMRILPLFVKD